MDIAIVGLGLIGGSLLRRWHRDGLAVTGFDADADTRVAARAAGLAVVDTVEELLGAEVLVSAVPLPALPGLLPRLAGYRGLLTDVTSVKTPVVELVWHFCPEVRFVPGHPMAGKETSGFTAADPGLFTDRVWVLCLDESDELADWLRLAELACGLGARVVPATVAEHDAAAARISHVPHAVAAALTLLAADPLSRAMAAGSFRDGTRVAQTRPELAAAMCSGNAAPVRAELDRLIGELSAARDRVDEAAAFTDWYTPAHRLRSGWPAPPAEPRPLAADPSTLLHLGRAGGWIEAVDPAAESVMTRQPVAQVA